MHNLTVLNDWHIGAVRTGGTTPATAYQLRQDLLATFEELLTDIDTDLGINGDLFDGPAISMADLLRTYRILDDWLVRTGKSLWLSDGNHDLSKNSTNFSSFQFLAKLLTGAEGQYAGLVTHIEGAGQMTLHGYVIPHVANQDLFDLELAKVPECKYLFVHCNYDNEFAVEADHSLNMSRAQAEALPVKHIVFGHEHQPRTELGGKVVIVGNQVPSSVSDCLGNDEKSFFQTVDDTYHLPITWEAAGDLAELPWQEVNGYEGPERFIRVTGTAAADEAAQVVQAISRFRQASKALVITNAVKIEGIDDQATLTLSVEQITAFNVRDALAELLTDDENKRINILLEQSHD